MPRKNSNLLDYGIDEEIDPKIKFNSLISVTVSTIMCLAARCPLPKSNVETTKLFLSTITDDYEQVPRNINGFLSLLNNYKGPYEYDSFKERRFDKTPVEKLLPVKEKCSLESVAETKIPVIKELSPNPELQMLVKRNSKTVTKKGERESKKIGKNMGSKSLISSKF